MDWVYPWLLADAPDLALYGTLNWDLLGICLLVFLCTFPVVIPFIFMSDPQLALRVSNAIAVVMLFFCGYAFGRHSGLNPWVMGLSMVAFGVVLVGVAITLGG